MRSKDLHKLLKSLMIAGLAIFLFHPVVVLAQEDFGCEEMSNKKAIKLFNKALEMPRSKHKESQDMLVEVSRLEPDFAEVLYILADQNWKKGMSGNEYTREKYLQRAKNYYLRVIDNCPAFDYYFSYYFVGRYHYMKATSTDDGSIDKDEAQKASDYYALFVQKNGGRNKDENLQAKSAMESLEEYLEIMNNPVPFNPVLVQGVSTRTDEFLPMISPDGEFLFYTHRFDSYDRYTTIQKQFEHFKISHKVDGDGELSFSSGESLPAPFNQGQKQGAAAITIDNNHIFMTICEFADCGGYGAYNNCDIYSSDYIDGEWTQFKNLGPNVNGVCTWESQPTVSADGKTLYFVSIREGNYTEDVTRPPADIYRSKLGDNDVWSVAENVGPTINTVKDEKSPFLHSDSKTLYFSSNGRTGVGGYDIYYARQLDGDEWGKPKNIGYPINTSDDDIGFMVSTDGKKAFLSSNKLDGSGGYDIYSFDLYKDARPEKVLFVKGQLKDVHGDEVSNAKIEMRSADGKRVLEGMVDKMTGKYAVAISYDEDEEFIMTVKKKDFAFTSHYFVPDEITLKDEPIELELEIKPIEIGTTVKLNNILFATNSAEFDNASRVVLNNFIEFMEENPALRIAIHGHTDNVGNAEANLDLSRRRAKAVADYLKEKGITTSRMTSKGFGMKKPVAPNTTVVGRALNRRTEFVITDK